MPGSLIHYNIAQPPRNAVLDLEHPLCHDIKAAILGSSPFNYYNGQKADNTANTSKLGYDWLATPAGLGVQNIAWSDAKSRDMANGGNVRQSMTAMCLIYYPNAGSQSTEADYFAKYTWTKNTTNAGWLFRTASGGTSLTFSLYNNNTTSDITANLGITNGDHNLIWLCGRYDGTTQALFTRVYVNGSGLTSVTDFTSQTNTTGWGNTTNAFGVTPIGNNSNNVYLVYGYFWKRALKDGELLGLQAAPYQIFCNRTTKRTFFVTFPGTTMYLHVGGVPAATQTLPTGYYGAWNQTDTSKAGSNAVTMDTNVPSGPQQSITKTFTAVTQAGGTQTLAQAQFVSQSLAAGIVIPAAQWTIGDAESWTQSGSSASYIAAASLYLVNSAGTLKTTIFTIRTFGTAHGLSSNSETTSFSNSIAGNSATTALNDYLVLEIGVSVTDNLTGGSVTPVQTLYSDGATAITADNVVTSDAQSFLKAPDYLTLTFASTSTGIVGSLMMMMGAGL